MKSLVPCAACNRHVTAEETVCPFCAAALAPQPDPRACSGPCAGHRMPRLGRAALATIGATLLCASCLPSGGVHYGTAATGTGGQTSEADGQAVTNTGGQTGHDGGSTGGAGGHAGGDAGTK